MDFQIATEYRPQGDQPRAIAEFTAGLRDGEKHQVLLGVGSGKTFTNGWVRGSKISVPVWMNSTWLRRRASVTHLRTRSLELRTAGPGW